MDIGLNMYVSPKQLFQKSSWRTVNLTTSLKLPLPNTKPETINENVAEFDNLKLAHVKPETDGANGVVKGSEVKHSGQWNR